ncbi:MAG: glutamine synthetase [Micrococcales bacterium]|nr:glutamine synthetase [Micrococcales bacterium]
MDYSNNATVSVPSIHPEPIMMLAICDYASQVRGKGFPVSALPNREQVGMALAPTNLMINAFGQTPATPWAARGELLMMPDPETALLIPGQEGHPESRMMLADLVELDGSTWFGCPRDALRRSLAGLRDEFGIQILAAFEHEFNFTGVDNRLGDAYLVESVESAGVFPGSVLAVMRSNGLIPDTFLAEFGPRQFEVTQTAVLGLKAADQAVQVREIVRRMALRAGGRASFSPLMEPAAVGNGVHVHFSLVDLDGVPVTFDRDDSNGISRLAGSFLSGVLRDIPDFVALTAASGISYDRLQPDRWSATYNNLGHLDREASLRLCVAPQLAGVDPASATNFEYRAADVSGNPYLVLGALAFSGLQGLRENLSRPHVTNTAPETMRPAERDELGLVHLPRSLGQALERFSHSSRLTGWLGSDFVDAYHTTKLGELESLANLSDIERVARYVAAY